MLLVAERLRARLETLIHKTIPLVLELQRWRSLPLDVFFVAVTFLAGTTIYAATIPTVLFFYPEPVFTRTCVALFFLITYNILIGNFLKNLFGLPRPFGEGLWAPIKERDFGFPSTHTINAIANTGFLVFTLTEGVVPRLVFLVYAALVAFSRLYMGVHSPADVACGVVIGVVHCVFMVHLHDVVVGLHSSLLLLPVFFVLHCLFLTVFPRCFTYNPTPRRTAMLCGCMFAASVVLSLRLQFTTDAILPFSEYFFYQMHRPFKFIMEYLLAIIVSLSVFTVLGFLLPHVLLTRLASHPKTRAMLSKIERVTSRYRVHCLADPIDNYECNATMLLYVTEVPLSYVSGFVAGLCVLYVAPRLILWMNPEMVLQHALTPH